jgi:hypothetical protein
MARDLPADRRDGPRNPLAISRIEEPQAIPREMFSRSASVSVSRERRRAAGAIPLCCANIN